MKSAYELALERMAADGIDKPRSGALADAVKERIAEARRRADARLAELEILEKKKLAAIGDPAEREKAEEQYLAERRRIEDNRDREIERLRRETASS